MTTKQDYYQFLKSAKEKRCGSLGSISTLKKDEMGRLARRLGYSALDPTKRLYSARNDPSINENSQIQVERRTPTRTRRTTTRQQPQEEKKQESWEEMKKRGRALVEKGDKMTAEEQDRAERTNKDTTTSAKFKKAREIKSKGFKLLREAELLRRQEFGLPSIEEERRRKIEEAKKKKKKK
jgi:hypothetical protein